MSDKSHLRKTMLSLTADRLRYAQGAYAQYLAGAAGRGDEPGEPDASAQAYNSGVLAASFECPIHTYEESLAALERIDFGPKEEVAEGAVVRVNGRWFVVAVATDAFECDGQTYMGISPEAPIFGTLAGASAGDVVEFNGRPLSIEAVR